MLFTNHKLNPKEYSPLALAYIGDSVYDLFIRSKVLGRGNRHVTQLHKDSVRFVKAHSQAESAYFIETELSDEEMRILKWGRNAKSNTVPKNADVTEYRMATGFETLLGYLYLDGKLERLEKLMEMAYEAISTNEF